ncbi:carbohydrate esterase family 5 protein [Neofusicoccum parvum]|nr:carbohydrate esterase family 5 protein [Neofusicoccum parvum]
MKPSYSSLLLSLFAAAAANPIAPRASCATGLHIIAARASGENPGPGIIGAVAQSIISRVPGSDLDSVVYPASINNVEDYSNSEHQGVVAMTKLVQDYVTACPNTKIALLGYSQGAEVVGDVLCGSSEDISPKTAPLGTQYSKSIIAAISMGSPAHVAGQPYNQGTSTRSGVSHLFASLLPHC